MLSVIQSMKNKRAVGPESLLAVLLKNGKMLKQLIEREYQSIELEQQTGFRAERSSIGHIFILQQLMEKNMSIYRPVYVLFVDLTKASDNIP